MSNITQLKKQAHWPTLNTVIMVEQAIKNADDSAISVAKLKKLLPRQVNHNTLMLILYYLEESNKIITGLKGITWISNPNSKLRRAINEGLEI